MGVREQKLQWPLTARESELAAFSQAWSDEQVQGVVLCGPAGVGKSRLAEACLTKAVQDGFEGGRATATAAAATVPLGAIAHLLPPGVDLSDPVKGFADVAVALSGPQGRRWALLIDDIHLLDATSTLLLRQLASVGVVRLIATLRTGERVTAAVEALTSSDAVQWIDLSLFSQEQTEGVLQAALGGSVARRTVQELYAATAGNVLYLRELVRGALEAGSLAFDGEIWELAKDGPAGTAQLTALIGARLAAAAPAAMPALELLALCEPLSVADAQAVASGEALAELEETGLVRITSERRRAYVQLAHPLYGEVLRSGIATLRRRTLLLEQAERVESRGARRRDDALHVATWRLAATGTADPELLLTAATLARHAHDYQQVVSLLEAVTDKQRSLVTLLMLGEALFQMGRWDKAAAVLADADARECSESEKLAVTLVRASNLLWSNAPASAALAVNEAAMHHISSQAGRHMLKINEGFIRISAGQAVEGLACLEELEPEADDASDINTWLRGALVKPFGLTAVGRTSEAVGWAERGYQAHLKLDTQALVSHPSVQKLPLVFAMAESGRLTDARALGEKTYAELTTADTIVRIWLATISGRVEWAAGHPATARRWWAEATSMARAIDHAMALHITLSGLTACAALLGDVAAAEAAHAQHQDLMALEPGILSAGETRLGEAWLQAARGHLSLARNILLEGAEQARTTGYAVSEAALLTDVVRLGDPNSAAGRLAELASQCDGVFFPARARFAAALAANDPNALLASASEFNDIGADLLACEAAAAAAARWRKNGENRRAASATQQLESWIARCQGARTPLLTTAESAATLTSREREVALLAAAGNTSKDIAAALHLSVRTVDNHLQRVYAKVGVTTRRQLATALEGSRFAGGQTPPGT
ncbi:LuxR C-terminal-related transcriptional regulator [Streptomyces sp. NPDC004787]|uniref:helix-turn-helix transcriptional regulator n=1 Tax=Streptomyces sp. NPDC004787 TaxID=3154291 RepID=UPI0033AC2A17